jgi:hypothetical protein
MHCGRCVFHALREVRVSCTDRVEQHRESECNAPRSIEHEPIMGAAAALSGSGTLPLGTHQFACDLDKPLPLINHAQQHCKSSCTE